MPLMSSVQEFANKNSKVQKWFDDAFSDDETREVYGSHLRRSASNST